MNAGLLQLRWSARRHLLAQVKEEDWRAGPLRRAAFAWQSAWFSINDRLQKKAYDQQLQRTDSPAMPIFILGFWRSGTTFLHELLSCDERFGYPTTTQCMNPSTMLLTNSAGRKASVIVERPMDGLPISSDSPQEDEFALFALGLPSAYQLLLKPADIDGALLALDPDAWSAAERARWSEGFDHFVRRLRLRDVRTLVFKSPTHSFRVSLLRALYPDARFITIRRDPIDVWHSNLRLWRVLCERYAFTHWNEADIERYVAEAYKLCASRLDEARRERAGNPPVECSFERLATRPISELESIYAHLDLAVTAQARAAWRDYLARRATYRPHRYSDSNAERRRILCRLGSSRTPVS